LLNCGALVEVVVTPAQAAAVVVVQVVNMFEVY
jgi:hypothetical protein